MAASSSVKVVRARAEPRADLRDALEQIQQVLHECSQREEMGSNGHVCNECANEIQRLVDRALKPASRA